MAVNDGRRPAKGHGQHDVCITLRSSPAFRTWISHLAAKRGLSRSAFLAAAAEAYATELGYSDPAPLR
jgi:hypothetical protein